MFVSLFVFVYWSVVCLFVCLFTCLPNCFLIARYNLKTTTTMISLLNTIYLNDIIKRSCEPWTRTLPFSSDIIRYTAVAIYPTANWNSWWGMHIFVTDRTGFWVSLYDLWCWWYWESKWILANQITCSLSRLNSYMIPVRLGLIVGHFTLGCGLVVSSWE